MGLSAAGPAAEIGGGLLGGLKGGAQQSQQNNAANQIAGTETSAINQLLQQYFGQAAPQIQALITQGLSGQGPLGSLLNFGAQQGPEIANFANIVGQGGQSAIDTFKSQQGGAANPNALIQSLLDSNNQNQLSTALGLQSQVAGQQLSGLQSGTSGIMGLLGQLTAPLGSALGGLQGLGAQYGANASALGNPYGQGISSIGQGVSGLGGLKGSGGSNALSGVNTGIGVSTPGYSPGTIS